MSTAFGKLHPKIQEAVWERRWEELRPLQIAAIDAICDGDAPVILAAATASGKTEAAFLPILSRLAASVLPLAVGVGVLYISPLKALINDQFRRVEELCDHAEIPVHRWHGDVLASEKRRLRERPSGVLLITPESLESQFINYHGAVARIYRDLRHVVIDELHAFLDNVRGIHLRSLLARLEIESGAAPRRVGLSATIGDFAPAQEFLCPDDPARVRVLRDEGDRKELRIAVKAYLEPADAGEEPVKMEGAARGLAALAEDVALRFRRGTNLVFCNSRRQTELLADRLRQIGVRERWAHDPFLLHHGSLSKDLREEAEERLRAGEAVSALCTSTLEMGIDLGAVATVGQVGSPWTVASLVQRLGRSGRREGEAQVLRLYALDEEITVRSSLTDRLFPELLRGLALVELLLEGWLEPAGTSRTNYSTCVHQVMSILRQTGGVRADVLHDKLCVRGAFRRVGEKEFLRLLRGLHEKEIIEQMATGELILAPAGEHIVEARTFYAAFASTLEYKVESGGQEIGTLPEDSLPAVGEFLLLAGRRWQVEAIHPRERLLVVIPARGWRKPQFNGGGSGLHPVVMRRMREILRGDGGYPFLAEPARELLAAARVAFAASGCDREGVLASARSVTLYPWAGSRVIETLALCAKAAGLRTACDSLSVRYEGITLEEARAHWREVTAGGISPADMLAGVASLERDRFDPFVPADLLATAYFEEALDFLGTAALCAKLAERGT